MKITREQKAAWSREVLRRKAKSSKAQTKESAEDGLDFDVSLASDKFYFDLTDDQVGDIYLELQPIIRKYEPIYSAFEESVFYKRYSPEMDHKANLEEKYMTPEQRLAVFMAYHSKADELHQMAVDIIWFTNFKSIMDWVVKSIDSKAANYYSLFFSDVRTTDSSKAKEKEGGNHQGDDERNEATSFLISLYEQYDIFRGATFNTYAHYFVPRHLAERRVPAGYSYHEYSTVRKLHGISKSISQKRCIPESEVLADEVIREYSLGDAKSLYNNDGSLSLKGTRYVEELVRQGFSKDSLTKEFIMSEYARTKAVDKISLAKYTRLMNVKDPEAGAVSLYDTVGSSDDGDSLLYVDTIDTAQKIGRSEDTLPPLQQFLKQESEMELKGRLHRILDTIPHAGIMLDIILEYADTDPLSRVKLMLKKKNPKHKLKEADIQKALAELFVEEVSRAYSDQCGVTNRVAKRYTENALLKLKFLNTNRRASAPDLIFDVRDDAVDMVSNADLFADIFADEQDKRKARTTAPSTYASTIFESENYAGDEDILDFGGIFE